MLENEPRWSLNGDGSGFGKNGEVGDVRAVICSDVDVADCKLEARERAGEPGFDAEYDCASWGRVAGRVAYRRSALAPDDSPGSHLHSHVEQRAHLLVCHVLAGEKVRRFGTGGEGAFDGVARVLAAVRGPILDAGHLHLSFESQTVLERALGGVQRARGVEVVFTHQVGARVEQRLVLARLAVWAVASVRPLGPGVRPEARRAVVGDGAVETASQLGGDGSQALLGEPELGEAHGGAGWAAGTARRAARRRAGAGKGAGG